MKLEYSRNQSTRMFESDVFETLSRVHPAIPFVFYIPLVVGVLAYALWAKVTTWSMAAAFFPLGWLTWSVMEYCIHRFYFHWEGNGPISRRLHEISHGYHHKFPDDDRRLVMPLSVSIPLALIVTGVLAVFRAPAATVPVFCGIVTGYLYYDFTHWSTHYRAPRTSYGRTLRAHHMAHHFADPNANFGISHRWIDWLIGTLKSR